MIYLYAIVERSARGRFPAGVDGARPRLVGDDLRAVVSDHDRAPAIDVAAALAHERVVEAAMKGGMLPMRAGTVLESESAVIALLRLRHDVFAGDLRRLRGRVELAVRSVAGPLPDGLAGHAEAATATGDRGSFLVAAEGVEDFLSAVTEVERSSGTRMVVTGPWPPYTFADTRREWSG